MNKKQMERLEYLLQDNYQTQWQLFCSNVVINIIIYMSLCAVLAIAFESIEILILGWVTGLIWGIAIIWFDSKINKKRKEIKLKYNQ